MVLHGNVMSTCKEIIKKYIKKNEAKKNLLEGASLQCEIPVVSLSKGAMEWTQRAFSGGTTLYIACVIRRNRENSSTYEEQRQRNSGQKALRYYSTIHQLCGRKHIEVGANVTDQRFDNQFFSGDRLTGFTEPSPHLSNATHFSSTAFFRRQ